MRGSMRGGRIGSRNAVSRSIGLRLRESFRDQFERRAEWGSRLDDPVAAEPSRRCFVLMSACSACLGFACRCRALVVDGIGNCS